MADAVWKSKEDKATNDYVVLINNRVEAINKLKAVVSIEDIKSAELGTLATPQAGKAIEVIKGEKMVVLYGHDRVNFINVQTEE